MSHEITSRDGVVLVRVGGWHGLGTVVEEAPSPEKALQIAGMDWDVEQYDSYIDRKRILFGDDGVTETTEKIRTGDVANVRSDTGEVLGTVSERYSVIQNRDLVGLIYAAAQNEDVVVETAGSLRAGRDVFFLCPLSCFRIGQMDDNYLYALVTNTHDGTGALTVTPTSIRVVCKNTQRAAIDEDERKNLTLRLPHNARLMERVGEVQACLRGARIAALKEVDRAEALASRILGPEEIAGFFSAVYARLYGEAKTDPKTRGERSKATRAVDMLGDWAGTLARECVALDQRPNAWLAANAVTNWIDHRRTIRGGDRLYSNLLGSAAEAKDTVFAEAAGLV